MTLLEICTAAMSANSGSLIIVCAIISAVILLASCLSAIIACSGFVYGWGKTPEVALATSVLYFVPGIPFCNAVCDLIYGHYICCVSRFLHAVIITVCLSLGLCIAFKLLNIQFI